MAEQKPHNVIQLAENGHTCVTIQPLDRQGLGTYSDGRISMLIQGAEPSGDPSAGGPHGWRSVCIADALRVGVVCLALFGVPKWMLAQATSGAMLATRGNVAVNGRVAGASQALLPGDLTVTERDAGGNLTQTGTNAMLGPETALRYEGEYVVLERGAVSANTQSGFAVQAGCWTIKPQLWNQWAEFAVSYQSAGEILIQARGSDIRVYGRARKTRDKKDNKSAGDDVTEAERNRDLNGAPIGNGNGALVQDTQPDRGELLRAGQEMRRESCPAAAQQQARQRPRGGAASAATTGPLNTTGALYTGGAAAGLVSILFLFRNDDPASPMKP